MASPRWYSSLYWRIAIGFVVFLAAMLVVQAVLFTWVVARSGRTVPGESPVRFGQTVAVDLAGALARDPALDVARYIREQYAQDPHPFFVMLADGAVITSGSHTFPEPLLRMARARLQRHLARPDGEILEPPDLDRPPERARRPGPLPRFVRPVPVIVDSRLAAVVVVPPSAPFGFLLGRFAPTFAMVAAGVLVVATAVTSALLLSPMRRRLRALEDDARRFTASDRARRQLLADVSHELTTPVTAMRGYLETLTMPELELDAATRARYLRIISDETSRLERIIGDLLDLARLEGSGGSLTLEQVPVAELFARVMARHERACQRAGVTMTEEIQPGAETVAADRNRLEQALQNLAANAIRYAPPGSAVRLTARPAHDTVTLAVEDAGPGIAPEHLPHIFDRFYKADQSRASMGAAQSEPGETRTGAAASGGSGLGLSIVKAIVERHGGRVSARSNPGSTVLEITGLRSSLEAARPA